MFRKIKSWSYSVYSTYKKCPKQLYYKKIEKLPEPKCPAMERGNLIHKQAEDYVTTSKNSRVPKELSKFSDLFKNVRKKGLAFAVEQSWAFTDKFKQQTEWRNWNGAWCRVKVDLVTKDKPGQYTVIDHKTGKVYEEPHAEQLELSALSTFLWIPDAKKITAENWYLDQGPGYSTPYEFKRAEVPALKKKWIAKVKPMMADSEFNERPGYHCRWCSFSKDKGGPCKYGDQQYFWYGQVSMSIFQHKEITL